MSSLHARSTSRLAHVFTGAYILLFLLLVFFCSQALIKSSVDSSGSPGKGLVLFIDLYCTIYRKYFDFLASNAALQSQVIFLSLFVLVLFICTLISCGGYVKIVLSVVWNSDHSI